MEIPQTTPPEAYDVLLQDASAVYLDVRSPEEFAAGHPAGARNVPIFFFRPGTHEPLPNPDFLAVVTRHVPPTRKVLVGCQSGIRSLRASEALLGAGYVDVTNVRGGFGGARDQTGRVVIPGWQESGLPVETGQTPGASWTDLAGGK